MTAKILVFPKPKLLSANVAPPVIEGEIVSADLIPALANRLAHLEPGCDAPPKRKRKAPAKPRARMRVEQVEVTCVKVPRKQHRDLRTLSGVLTLDFKGDVPWTFTFDPDDANIQNIVAPIEAFTRTDDSVKITSDEGVWTFEPLLSEDDEDDEHKAT